MNHNRGRKKSQTSERKPYFAAMGIRRDSFYKHIMRMRSGINMRKWEIYEDELDEIEEEAIE